MVRSSVFLVVGCLIQLILYGFYDHHRWRAGQQSKEEMRDAEERERGERKRENIILIREERERNLIKYYYFLSFLLQCTTINSYVL